MLYLERRRAAQDSAKEHGLEVTPEDSFFAIIHILSGDAKFYGKANELYGRYMGSIDDVERDAVIEEAGVVIHEYRVAVYGEELVRTLSYRSPGHNVGEFVSAEGVFEGYGYKIQPKDVELLQQMIVEVHQLSGFFRQEYAKYCNGDPRWKEMFDSLGGILEDADFDKLALAYVIDKRRVPWHVAFSPLKAIVAFVLGGGRNVSYFQNNSVFCADLAIVCKILADEIGYLAQIKSVVSFGDKRVHQYAEFDDGSIYDPFSARSTYGYRKDNPYKEYAK